VLTNEQQALDRRADRIPREPRTSFPVLDQLQPGIEDQLAVPARTSPGMSPVALNSCHNTTSSTGDDHRSDAPPVGSPKTADRRRRRGIGDRLAEPLSIAKTVADVVVALKGLTPV